MRNTGVHKMDTTRIQQQEEIAMDEQTLNARYKKLVRAKTPKSGARWQKAKEIPSRVTGEESSAYWNWEEAHGRKDQFGTAQAGLNAAPELDRAPDFDATTHARNQEIENEVTGRVRKLMELAKQILTQQQYNVFILTMVKDPALTYREAGKVLGISFGRVRQHADTLRAKLERAYNERT